ncbi:MAG TPA: bacillithiol biosynthesis cysteine-adding enzyme BshC [Pseudogracilibacillus sp.]|nr:bacillithiol biosynthesis cysteine-adding enzyme BshC [Pseudogracilibacillus sp.]
MQVTCTELNNKNKLNKMYRAHEEPIISYFEYDPFGDFKHRLEDLKKRTYQRESLADVLTKMNANWGAANSSLEQIERLKQSDSVAVVGGQQAGLLTGPLYSINKLISIVHLAKQQEKELNVPVIPVFWIAGEDHDFDEINHVYSDRQNRAYKHKLDEESSVKKSISDMTLNHDNVKEWLTHFLRDLEETSYTNEWFGDTLDALQKSNTYTDFFARLIFQLFPEQGIVLLDAHAKEIRELETAYFLQMIEHHEEIHQSTYKTLQTLQQEGFDIPLDIEEGETNLFYHGEANDRVLLKYIDGEWIGKHEEVRFSTEEMKEIAGQHPEKLSNNVVTRPLMQELLLPTLAFVAGDGEINYWATLKKAFQVLDVQMPPVVPRLSFTYVTNRVQKLMKKRVVEAEDIIRHGAGSKKVQWLTNQTTAPLNVLFEEVKTSMADVHAPLQTYAKSISPDLEQLAQQNQQYIEQQVQFLKDRIDQHLEMKYQHQISQFDELELFLRPRQTLQERIWSPYTFINSYGYQFLRDLMEKESLDFRKEHFIVHL